MLNEALLARIDQRVIEKCPRTFELWQRNRSVMPGGCGNGIGMIRPIPFMISRSEGGRVWDEDGNEFVDCMISQECMMLGGKPQCLVDAIVQQVQDVGLGFGAAYAREYELAKMVCDSIPSVQKLTFCVSGTEATMMALKLARAATGRKLIAKIEGGYHGIHDNLHVSGPMRVDDLGPLEAPNPVPNSAGMLADTWRNTIVLPLNHEAALTKIRQLGRELAAVIVEPVQAWGPIEAQQWWLQGLRAATRETGALLIMDEVITWPKLGMGGGQGYFGVDADITTFGKLLGGGIPIGAVGGTDAVMNHISGQSLGRGNAVCAMGGTFAALPLAMEAGIAAIGYCISHPEIFPRMFAMRERVVDAVQAYAQEKGYAISMLGSGPLYKTYFLPHPPKNMRESFAEDLTTRRAWNMLLRVHGLHTALSGLCFVADAHTDADVAAMIEAHRRALDDLRRYELV
ncbi:MAG: aminotransferase class III-fold pyridoxal phosphate-dependent enzyme [Steroidobacteraceae bacterium]